MGKPHYRVGDEIVVTEKYWNQDPHIPVGSIGTVVDIYYDYNWVRFEHCEQSQGFDHGGWKHHDSQIRHITPLDKLL